MATWMLMVVFVERLYSMIASRVQDVGFRQMRVDPLKRSPFLKPCSL